MSTGDPPLVNINTIGSSTWWSATKPEYITDKNLNEIVARIEEIEKRLLILLPDNELCQKFPALKEAYDHYKLIEKLVSEGKNETNK